MSKPQRFNTMEPHRAEYEAMGWKTVDLEADIAAKHPQEPCKEPRKPIIGFGCTHEKTPNGNFYGVSVSVWRIAVCFAINWLDKETS